VVVHLRKRQLTQLRLRLLLLRLLPILPLLILLLLSKRIRVLLKRLRKN
jgi:hypothetical protein